MDLLIIGCQEKRWLSTCDKIQVLYLLWNLLELITSTRSLPTPIIHTPRQKGTVRLLCGEDLNHHIIFVPSKVEGLKGFLSPILFPPLWGLKYHKKHFGDDLVEISTQLCPGGENPGWIYVKGSQHWVFQLYRWNCGKSVHICVPFCSHRRDRCSSLKSLMFLRYRWFAFPETGP